MLLTATLPSLVYFFLMAKNRGGRFFFTFCLADIVMIWMMLVTGLIDYAVGSDGLVNFILWFAVFRCYYWRLGGCEPGMVAVRCYDGTFLYYIERDGRYPCQPTFATGGYASRSHGVGFIATDLRYYFYRIVSAR